MSQTQAVERHTPQPTAVEAISDREFTALQHQAAVLSKSGIVPKPLQGKPDDILVVFLTGRDMDIPPMSALSQIYVINGRPAPSAQLLQSLANRAGHEIWIEETTPETCTAAGKRRGSQKVQRITWTIAMARAAKLADKDVWKSFPAAMLRARAISNLCRIVAPDALLGIHPHTPDEMGLDEGGDDTHEVIDAADSPARGAIEASATETPAPEDLPVSQRPFTEEDETLAGLEFTQRFGKACREAGMTEDERHALIAHVTDGRTASSKLVRKDEVALLGRWFSAIKAESYGFVAGEGGALRVEKIERPDPSNPDGVEGGDSF